MGERGEFNLRTHCSQIDMGFGYNTPEYGILRHLGPLSPIKFNSKLDPTVIAEKLIDMMQVFVLLVGFSEWLHFPG